MPNFKNLRECALKLNFDKFDILMPVQEENISGFFVVATFFRALLVLASSQSQVTRHLRLLERSRTVITEEILKFFVAKKSFSIFGH